MEKFRELADELLRMPEEVKNLQLELLNYSEQAQEVLNKTQALESVIKSEIDAEIGENGKKLYSNDTARKAAFMEMSDSNEELHNRKEEYNAIQKVVSEYKMDIEELSNQQRNIRSVLDFIGKVGE